LAATLTGGSLNLRRALAARPDHTSFLTRAAATREARE
jgi:hypothetical protein